MSSQSANNAKTRKKGAQRPAVQKQEAIQPINTVPDPELEKQITKLVMGFMGRILLSFFVLAILIEVGITQAKIPTQKTLPILTVATFGIMFPFVRGAAKVFKEIKRLGVERLERRKYADAAFALEYFHRFGQMSFDPMGEAHYHLVRALIGLGDFERASKMVTWMQTYRRRFEWTSKAATALETAERKRQGSSPGT